MREKYESLALVQLKELAKVRGLKGTSTMKKAEIVEAMLAEDERLKKSRSRTRLQRSRTFLRRSLHPRHPAAQNGSLLTGVRHRGQAGLRPGEMPVRCAVRPHPTLKARAGVKEEAMLRVLTLPAWRKAKMPRKRKACLQRRKIRHLGQRA